MICKACGGTGTVSKKVGRFLDCAECDMASYISREEVFFKAKGITDPLEAWIEAKREAKIERDAIFDLVQALEEEQKEMLALFMRGVHASVENKGDKK